mgnify:CR=1 FL=1
MSRIALYSLVIIVVIAVCIGVYLLLIKPQEIIMPEDLIINVKKTFTLESPAFGYGENIPRKYSLEGRNLSPPLQWRDAPPNTISFVLIMYDPDAPKGIFYHWILYNIPSTITSLPEGIPPKKVTPYGLQGVNDYGSIGYGGPHPPSGTRHRYIFLLLALDKELTLEPGAKINDVLKACKGHVIGYAKLLGYYSR